MKILYIVGAILITTSMYSLNNIQIFNMLNSISSNSNYILHVLYNDLEYMDNNKNEGATKYIISLIIGIILVAYYFINHGVSKILLSGIIIGLICNIKLNLGKLNPIVNISKSTIPMYHRAYQSYIMDLIDKSDDKDTIIKVDKDISDMLSSYIRSIRNIVLLKYFLISVVVFLSCNLFYIIISL